MKAHRFFPGCLARHFTPWDGIAAACAAVYWILYCAAGLDLHFFTTANTKYRLAFLCLLIVLAIAALRLGRRVFVEKDRFSRRFVLYAAVNLAVLLFFLLLLWPGTWSWDDIYVLNGAQTYSFVAWQHFLSSVAIIFSAFLIPSAGGIAAVQVVILALISGYLLALFDVLFLDANRRFYGAALLIADLCFFLPPLLLYASSRYRSTLCAYLELFLFAFVVRLVKFPALRRAKNIAFVLALVVLIASWRSENIYYAPLCFFILLLLLGRKYWKRCLALALAVCVLTVGIGRYNTRLIGTNDYSVVAVINQVTALTRRAVSEDDPSTQTALDQIDRVLDVDRLISEPDKTGSALYWEGVAFSYTEEEYRDFLSAYLHLILKYPFTFLQECTRIFSNALGINDNQQTLCQSAIAIYQPGTSHHEIWGEDRPALNVSLRASTIRLLGGLDGNDQYTLLSHIFFNLIPPMLLSLAALLFFLFRRKPLPLLFSFAIFCKVPLIFLTAPGGYFMYFLSIYLFGYLVLFFTLSLLFNRNCKRKEPLVS